MTGRGWLTKSLLHNSDVELKDNVVSVAGVSSDNGVVALFLIGVAVWVCAERRCSVPGYRPRT